MADWLEKLVNGAKGAEEILEGLRQELPRRYIPKEKYNELSQSKKELEQAQEKQRVQAHKGFLIDTGLLDAQRDMGLRDRGLARLLLDEETIALEEDGGLAGLREQLEHLREQKPFLFMTEPLTGRTPFAGQDPPGLTKAQFAAMGYRERARLFEQKPALYQNLSE